MKKNKKRTPPSEDDLIFRISKPKSFKEKEKGVSLVGKTLLVIGFSILKSEKRPGWCVQLTLYQIGMENNFVVVAIEYLGGPPDIPVERSKLGQLVAGESIMHHALQHFSGLSLRVLKDRLKTYPSPWYWE